MPEVTPPDAGKPVEIDQLVEIGPLPTLDDEKALAEQAGQQVQAEASDENAGEAQA